MKTSKAKTKKIGGMTIEDQRKRFKRRSEHQAKNAGKGIKPFGNKPLDLSKFNEDEVVWYESKEDNRLYFIPFIVKTDNCPGFIDTDEKMDQGEITHFLPIYSHRNVGMKKHDIICPMSNMNTDNCPICEDQSKYPYGSKEYNALKATCRPIYNVIDADNPDKGIQLFQAPAHFLEKELQDKLKRLRTKGRVFTHFDLDEGIVVEFVGEELTFKAEDGTVAKYYKYKEFAFVKEKKLSWDKVEEALSLDKHMVLYSYDEIRELQGAKHLKDEVEEDDEEENTDNDNSDEEIDGSDIGTDEPFEEENTDNETEEENPDCFAKEYEDNDPEGCQNCSCEDECKKAFEAKKKTKKKGKGKGKAKTKKKEVKSDGECPHGGEYGVTTDDLKECEDDCDIYLDCMKQYEENNK
jgi:hypothetical protein